MGMLVGYNTNISFKGKVYHVQTEDSGQTNPVIVTLLYAQGAILASKKTSYTHIINEPDWKQKVQTLMKEQHKIMIKELVSGKYTGEYTSSDDSKCTVEPPADTVETHEQASKSLDDILLNYIIKRTKR
jgi:hypothetical protein